MATHGGDAMTARGPWFITPHAVARYIEWTACDLTYEEGLRVLLRESQLAELRKQLDSGALLYLSRIGGPRFRFVVQQPAEPDSLPQLVTVMRPYDQWEPRPPTSAAHRSQRRLLLLGAAGATKPPGEHRPTHRPREPRRIPPAAQPAPTSVTLRDLAAAALVRLARRVAGR